MMRLPPTRMRKSLVIALLCGLLTGMVGLGTECLRRFKNHVQKRKPCEKH